MINRFYKFDPSHCKTQNPKTLCRHVHSSSSLSTLPYSLSIILLNSVTTKEMSAPEHLPQVLVQDLDDDKKEIKNLQIGISEAQQDSDFHAINTLRQTIAGNLEGVLLGLTEASEIDNKNNGALKVKKRNRPNGMGKASNVTAVEGSRQDCGKLRKEDKKGFYSRKELEAMRFVSVEEQRKKWVEVYCGLGPDVQKEYDGLARSIDQKQLLVDFDLRRQFGKARHVSFGIISLSLTQWFI